MAVHALRSFQKYKFAVATNTRSLEISEHISDLQKFNLQTFLLGWIDG